MSTEIESLAVPLIGALPQSITDQPAVLIIYLLLIVAIGSALASVLLRSMLYAIAAFAVTMAAVAFLYLMLAPFLLFAGDAFTSSDAHVRHVERARQEAILPIEPRGANRAQILCGIAICATRPA